MKQTFAGLKNEGYTFPPWVVNPERGRGVGWADRVMGHGIVIKVAGFAMCRYVLAEQSILTLDRRDSPEYFDLISHRWESLMRLHTQRG